MKTSGLDSIVPQIHIQLSSRFPPAAGGEKSLLTLPSDDVKVALESDTKVPFSAIAGSLPCVRNLARSTTNQLEPRSSWLPQLNLGRILRLGKGDPIEDGTYTPQLSRRGSWDLVGITETGWSTALGDGGHEHMVEPFQSHPASLTLSTTAGVPQASMSAGDAHSTLNRQAALQTVPVRSTMAPVDDSHARALAMDNEHTVEPCQSHPASLTSPATASTLQASISTRDAHSALDRQASPQSVPIASIAALLEDSHTHTLVMEVQDLLETEAELNQTWKRGRRRRRQLIFSHNAAGSRLAI
ncbi:hypothetical protein FRB94_002715 [Tulasnella sp. JGI-2019a]|nr:hypothetical protein FRB94_002715 [Tulasnella sp. JGI-2019a]